MLSATTRRDFVSGLSADEVYDVEGVTPATFASVANRGAVDGTLSKVKA